MSIWLSCNGAKTGVFFSPKTFSLLKSQFKKKKKGLKLKTCQDRAFFYYHLHVRKSHLITSCDNKHSACHNKCWKGTSMCPPAMLLDFSIAYWCVCTLMLAHHCRQNPSSAHLGHWGLSCGRGPCTGWRAPSPAWLWANQRARTGDSHSGDCWSADAWDRWRKRLVALRKLCVIICC